MSISATISLCLAAVLGYVTGLVGVNLYRYERENWCTAMRSNVISYEECLRDGAKSLKKGRVW